MGKNRWLLAALLVCILLAAIAGSWLMPRGGFGALAPAVWAALPLEPLSTVQAGVPRDTAQPSVCGESQDTWHPPVINGCAAGHEHGDAPPAWVAASGYPLSFHGAFNTSPAENTAKHAAMKGVAARFNNQDVYFRIHAASNPLDRMARYHSYELWIRDTSGAVSHMQGWYNTGDPRPASEGGARYARRRGVEPQQRPIILTPDETSVEQGINCEQWYTNPGETVWGPDFGWTICNTTTMYRANENATAYDQGAWVRYAGTNTGTTRRLELAWYAHRSDLRGRFVTDQFGEQINSCVEGRDVVKFGTTYKTVCLEQVIAPTIQTIDEPDNALQTSYPDDGVQLPN